MKTGIYKHKIVRDLAWVLTSPPLLQPADATIHWPAPEWYVQQFAASASLLTKLDSNPAELQHFLDAKKDRRLGAYYESLWHYWLQQNNRYDVLHKNLQIHAQQRTIGEFDLLIHDRQSAQTQHWELAIKFYLGTGDTYQLSNWHGPRLNDNFSKKYHALTSKQIKLAAHPASKAYLQQADINIDSTRILLQGRLFYPRQQQMVLPQHACSAHQHSWWCDSTLFNDTYPASTTRVQILEKPDWLTPAWNTSTESLSVTELVSHVETLGHPCYVIVHDKEIDESGFVVPLRWQRAAQESL